VEQLIGVPEIDQQFGKFVCNLTEISNAQFHFPCLLSGTWISVPNAKESNLVSPITDELDVAMRDSITQISDQLLQVGDLLKLADNRGLHPSHQTCDEQSAVRLQPKSPTLSNDLLPYYVHHHT